MDRRWISADRPDDHRRLLSPSLLIFRDDRPPQPRRDDRDGRGRRSAPAARQDAQDAGRRAAGLEALGIRKHKCATIAEAEMIAAAGGADVLIAYPLVGPEPRPPRRA